MWSTGGGAKFTDTLELELELETKAPGVEVEVAVAEVECGAIAEREDALDVRISAICLCASNP